MRRLCVERCSKVKTKCTSPQRRHGRKAVAKFLCGPLRLCASYVKCILQMENDYFNLFAAKIR